jgi:phosphonate transport system substrate-binding protein
VLSEKFAGLDYEGEYRGSTENVIKTVSLGKAAAGVTLSVVMDKMPEYRRREIRTLLKTGEIPFHPLSAHPRVALFVQLAVKKAILDLGTTPEGKKLLGDVRLPSPVVADYERDYRALEGIDVKTISNWSN